MFKEDTPIISQWKNIKSNYPDNILFYRLGDFYELFYEDAKKTSRLLNITLTRKKNKEEDVPMAGIPYHAAESYISKLLKYGESIAICEQIGEVIGSGPMKREVVRVITAGTIIEEGFLEDKKENILTSLFFDPKSGVCGISNIELSTGRFSVQEVKLEDISSELKRIDPSEVLATVDNFDFFASNLDCSKFKFLPIKDISQENSSLKLKEHFNVSSLSVFNCDSLTSGLISSSIVIDYIKDKYKGSLGSINKLLKIENNNYIHIDRNTRLNLELNETINGEHNGSLFSIINNTYTPMGSRNLKRWLNSPLRNIEQIKERQDAILELSSKKQNLGEILDNFLDIERIVGRVGLKSARPKDLLNLNKFLNEIPLLKISLNGFESSLLKKINENISEDKDILSLLTLSINEDCPTLLRDGNVIKDGYDEELDELRSLLEDSSSYILNIENEEKIKTGIDKLKVCYHKAQGFYIEIPNGKLEKVPSNYIRKQTLKNCERFTIEKLKLLEDKSFSANTKSMILEKILFEEVLNKVSKSILSLQKSIESICDLDCLVSLAYNVNSLNLCKPIFGNKYDIKNGRHLVVESIKEDFTPNDVYMNEEKKCLLITGPNMGGKSTYMRQVAQITILAHIGSFVPATECCIPLIDKIFTRIGASDNINNGLSTFMVEMVETANILNNATPNSLVLMDEIGRGTSTYDGLSIAWSVLKNISTKINCFTLFSTHYFELTKLENKISTIKNISFEANFKNNSLIFNHKINSFPATKSYGIDVAALAGIPSYVLNDANSKLKSLELKIENTNYQKEIDSIRNLNMYDLSPKDALIFLYNLNKNLKK